MGDGVTTTVVLTNASFDPLDESEPAADASEPATLHVPLIAERPDEELVDFEISLAPAEAAEPELPSPAASPRKAVHEAAPTMPASTASTASTASSSSSAATQADQSSQALDARPVLPQPVEAGIRPTASAQKVAHNVVRRRGESRKAADADMPALLKASADEDLPENSADVLTPQVEPAAEPRKAPSKPRKPARERKVVQTPPEDDLSFVREAKRRQFWRRPLVRLMLVLGLCVALLAVATRWVHGNRDWLAASYPDAKPLLQQMCGVLGCQLKPYRMLEGVAIDSSSFNRSADGSFRLNLSLRNTEALEIATPSVELTLTDADDRAVAKQVVTPAMLRAPEALRARRDWTGGLPLKLEPAQAAQVAGYRLSAFYP